MQAVQRTDARGFLPMTEPDAYEVKTSDESWHDSRNIDTTIVRRFTYIPAHEREGKEPLFSESTIAETIDQRIEQLKEWKQQKYEKVKKESPEHRAKTVASKSYDREIKELEELKEEFKQKTGDKNGN